jgi:hypothetical protein
METIRQEANELYNETKSATKKAVRNLIGFVNKGGNVKGYLSNPTETQKETLKIVNEKNWECIERATLSNGGNLLTIYKMNNGIYSYSHEGISYGDNRLNIPTREYKSYSCAK